MSIVSRAYRSFLPAALAAASLAVIASACGTVEPGTDPWVDVRSFAWPTSIGDTFVYEHVKLGTVQSLDAYRLIDSQLTYRQASGYWVGDNNYFAQFLSTADTLYVDAGQLPQGNVLVSPLEKGHAWQCTTDSSERRIYDATIAGRFSFRNVAGTVYDNVLQVDYVPRDSVWRVSGAGIWSVTGFYAKNIGLVQLIRYNATRQDTTRPVVVGELERWSLKEVRNGTVR